MLLQQRTQLSISPLDTLYVSSVYLSLTLIGKSLLCHQEVSLSWEKKGKFPIGMFCRKTRSAVGGMTAVQRILSGVQRV